VLDFRRPASSPKFLNRHSHRYLWMLVMATGFALLMFQEGGDPERMATLMRGATRLGSRPADNIDTRWHAHREPGEPVVSMVGPEQQANPPAGAGPEPAPLSELVSDDPPDVPLDHPMPHDDAPPAGEARPAENTPPADDAPDVPLDADPPAAADNPPTTAPADAPPAESNTAPATSPAAPAAPTPSDAALLAKVQDDTYFRPEDSVIWYRLLARLRDTPPAELARESTGTVTFAQLFRQPTAYRGKVIDLVGSIWMAVEKQAPANDQGIERYYQLWLRPEDNGASPIAIYCLKLPDNFPLGDKLDEPVRLSGIFFKRWVYSARDTIRLAPLVLAASVDWRPNPLAPQRAAAEPIPYWVIGLTAVVALLFVTVLWTFGRRDSKYSRYLIAQGNKPIEIAPPPRRVTDAPGPMAATLPPGELASLEASTDAEGWPNVD